MRNLPGFQDFSNAKISPSGRNDRRNGQYDSLICHSEPCPEPFGGACTERIEVLRVNSCEGACEESCWFQDDTRNDRMTVTL
ncbi:MAG: hypothetical protein HYW01_05760 [Deltaproteobacteria bacterium]|nr:hypothetical protein [Deltaproteobacteria bacterium]